MIPPAGFTGGRMVDVDGAKLAVISCEHCGSALLIDPRDEISVVARHRVWHDETARQGVDWGEVGH